MIMDCFDCLFISMEDLAYFISIFSLVSRFVLFLATPALRVQRTSNLIRTLRNGQQFFTLFGRKYYFIQKLKFSYYNNIFRKVIAKGVIGLITLLSGKLRCQNFNSWRKYFPLWHFIENQVFTISALFPYFSAFSLFKLMELVSPMR